MRAQREATEKFSELLAETRRADLETKETQYWCNLTARGQPRSPVSCVAHRRSEDRPWNAIAFESKRDCENQCLSLQLLGKYEEMYPKQVLENYRKQDVGFLFLETPINGKTIKLNGDWAILMQVQPPKIQEETTRAIRNSIFPGVLGIGLIQSRGKIIGHGFVWPKDRDPKTVMVSPEMLDEIYESKQGEDYCLQLSNYLIEAIHERWPDKNILITLGMSGSPLIGHTRCRCYARALQLPISKQFYTSHINADSMDLDVACPKPWGRAGWFQLNPKIK